MPGNANTQPLGFGVARAVVIRQGEFCEACERLAVGFLGLRGGFNLRFHDVESFARGQVVEVRALGRSVFELRHGEPCADDFRGFGRFRQAGVVGRRAVVICGQDEFALRPAGAESFG